MLFSPETLSRLSLLVRIPIKQTKKGRWRSNERQRPLAAE